MSVYATCLYLFSCLRLSYPSNQLKFWAVLAVLCSPMKILTRDKQYTTLLHAAYSIQVILELSIHITEEKSHIAKDLLA
jgi:hypothetical protein